MLAGGGWPGKQKIFIFLKVFLACRLELNARRQHPHHHIEEEGSRTGGKQVDGQ